MSTMTKADLHRLIDALGEPDVDRAGRVLAALLDDDPVGLSLAVAPVDDEPLTEAEAAALDEAYAALRRGDVIADAALRRELGG